MSPFLDAFDIYITNASVRGATTWNWLATIRDRYIKYAAYSNMSVYKNLVNVARTTISWTKAFAPGIANTLEMVTLIKLSNAPEKGDNFWNGILKKFFRGAGVRLYTVYNFR